MRERRGFIRIPVGLEVCYQAAEGKRPLRLAMTEDLSLGGMQIWQPEPLEQGQKVNVDFTLPKEGHVALHGVVAWCREAVNGRGGYKAGIQWEELHPPSQARLNAFLIDRTKSRSQYSRVPKIQSASAIIWPRALSLGVFIFALLLAGGLFWLDRTRLQTEVSSLRFKASSYERQIRAILSHNR